MEKKFRLLLLLALLMTAATGAWAQEQSETIETASSTGTTVYTGEHFKITASLSCDGAGIVLAKPSNNGGKATIEALNGEMITKVEIHLRYGGTYATKTTATKGELVATDKTGENDISVINVNANSVVIGTTQSGSWIQVNKFVVYYSVPPTYTVSLKEGTKDAANWTISPSKATTDGVAEGTEVTLQYNGRLKVKGVKATSDAAPAVKPAATVTTAPTAKTGVKAGEDVAIVNAGAATGGTMMYKVTTENTKPTSTEGFSDALPTAKTLAAGTYYVWYYVKADDSHTDSEISATAIAVTVKAGTPEYYNKLTKINDNARDQQKKLKFLGRGYESYNSSLTAAQAYALATYQAAIDGQPVYVIMSSQDSGYEIHYAVSTDASATEHTASLYDICNGSNRMYYVAP